MNFQPPHPLLHLSLFCRFTLLTVGHFKRRGDLSGNPGGSSHAFRERGSILSFVLKRQWHLLLYLFRISCELCSKEGVTPSSSPAWSCELCVKETVAPSAYPGYNCELCFKETVTPSAAPGFTCERVLKRQWHHPSPQGLIVNLFFLNAIFFQLDFAFFKIWFSQDWFSKIGLRISAQVVFN